MRELQTEKVFRYSINNLNGENGTSGKMKSIHPLVALVNIVENYAPSEELCAVAIIEEFIGIRFYKSIYCQIIELIFQRSCKQIFLVLKDQVVR